MAARQQGQRERGWFAWARATRHPPREPEGGRERAGRHSAAHARASARERARAHGRIGNGGAQREELAAAQCRADEAASTLASSEEPQRPGPQSAR